MAAGSLFRDLYADDSPAFVFLTSFSVSLTSFSVFLTSFFVSLTSFSVFFNSLSCFGGVDTSSVTFWEVSIRERSGWEGVSSNRSVVDQCNLHHGLEDAVLDPICLVAFLNFTIKVLI